jgi:hypothetical protein
MISATLSVRPVLQRTARLVLAWFVACLVVAAVAPWMQAEADEICAPAAAAQASPTDDGGKSLPHQLHKLDCPLCLVVAGPPAATAVLPPTDAPLAYALLPHVAAHLAGLTGAPLPARGPPAFS